MQLVKFMAATKDDVLTLSMGEIAALHNWVDASFAAHLDHKSHGRLASIMKGGKGAILSGSEKQKLNTNSSTSIFVEDCVSSDVFGMPRTQGTGECSMSRQ